VNLHFHGGTKIGKGGPVLAAKIDPGGPVLAAKIGPGGPVLAADRFFRYRPNAHLKARGPPRTEILYTN